MSSNELRINPSIEKFSAKIAAEKLAITPGSAEEIALSSIFRQEARAARLNKKTVEQRSEALEETVELAHMRLKTFREYERYLGITKGNRDAIVTAVIVDTALIDANFLDHYSGLTEPRKLDFDENFLTHVKNIMEECEKLEEGTLSFNENLTDGMALALVRILTNLEILDNKIANRSYTESLGYCDYYMPKYYGSIDPESPVGKEIYDYINDIQQHLIDKTSSNKEDFGNSFSIDDFYEALNLKPEQVIEREISKAVLNCMLENIICEDKTERFRAAAELTIEKISLPLKIFFQYEDVCFDGRPYEREAFLLSLLAEEYLNSDTALPYLTRHFEDHVLDNARDFIEEALALRTESGCNSSLFSKEGLILAHSQEIADFLELTEHIKSKPLEDLKNKEKDFPAILNYMCRNPMGQALIGLMNQVKEEIDFKISNPKVVPFPGFSRR